MGRFGLGYRETLMLRPEEFEEIAWRWHERQEHDARQAWERMRLHAVMTLQPHSSRTLRPDKLLPLPWDKAAADNHATDTTQKPPAARSTPEAFRKAIEAAGQS
ncbi:MAG: hypothetical protein NC230_09280 [Bacteroides sp.]|nr:hypothetical protein [Bacteroides sp.]